MRSSIINYINHYVSYNSEEEKLNKIFKQSDKKGKGMISLEESEHLFNVFFMEKSNVQNFFQKNKIMKILENEKQIKKGFISNDIFIKIAMEQVEKLNEANLKNAFDKFHISKDAMLTKEEIQSVLSKKDFKYKKELLQQINSKNESSTNTSVSIPIFSTFTSALMFSLFAVQFIMGLTKYSSKPFLLKASIASFS